LKPEKAAAIKQDSLHHPKTSQERNKLHHTKQGIVNSCSCQRTLQQQVGSVVFPKTLLCHPRHVPKKQTQLVIICDHKKKWHMKAIIVPLNKVEKTKCYLNAFFLC